MSIQVSPVAGGAGDGGPASAFLLELDGARILLDCGTRDRPAEDLDGTADRVEAEARQRTYLDELVKLGPTLDLVVLTHPLLDRLGALPFLKARGGLRCPVYATLPVKEMGRWAVHEWCQQRRLEEDAGSPADGEGGRTDQGDLPDKPRASKKRKLQDVQMQRPEDPATTMRDAAGRSAEDGDALWKVSFDEVQAAFDSIIGIRYSQPVHLSGTLAAGA